MTETRQDRSIIQLGTPGGVPVVRMSGRGLPAAGRLQDLLGDGCLVVGAPRSAEVVLMGSPTLTDIRLTCAEQPESLVVVLLTAEADANLIVAAYEAGADLVVRGAESRELAARVRALLRRRASSPANRQAWLSSRDTMPA